LDRGRGRDQAVRVLREILDGKAQRVHCRAALRREPDESIRGADGWPGSIGLCPGCVPGRVC